MGIVLALGVGVGERMKILCSYYIMCIRILCFSNVWMGMDGLLFLAFLSFQLAKWQQNFKKGGTSQG